MAFYSFFGTPSARGLARGGVGSVAHWHYGDLNRARYRRAAWRAQSVRASSKIGRQPAEGDLSRRVRDLVVGSGIRVSEGPRHPTILKGGRAGDEWAIYLAWAEARTGDPPDCGRREGKRRSTGTNGELVTEADRLAALRASQPRAGVRRGLFAALAHEAASLVAAQGARSCPLRTSFRPELNASTLT